MQSETISPAHLKLGAVLLLLVSDWDAWVSRRVDSFYFAGDDERVLHRKQSVDFALPLSARKLRSHLLLDYGGFPAPITFVTKWRLDEFSFHDGAGHACSLMQREDSARLAAAMLIVLGMIEKERSDTHFYKAPASTSEMPRGVRQALCNIVSGEPDAALQLCLDFQDPRLARLARAEEIPWRVALARSELFMSLAFELARGFMLATLVPPDQTRHLVKFSYNSYVVPDGRDPWPVRIGHAWRWLGAGSRDAIDPTAWLRSSPRRRRRAKASDPAQTGSLTISTGCQDAPSQLRFGAPSIACGIARLKGADGWQHIRIRPSGVVSLHGLPPGEYSLTLSPRSGYLFSRQNFQFELAAGSTTRIHVGTRRRTFPRRQTRAAPRVSARPWRGKRMVRGLGWNSKPLVIRVRLGGGGSYHCEFEAPAGLHVTRGRLVSNLEGNEPLSEPSQAERTLRARARYVDTVLESAQRSHLYSPVREGGPSTGYVFLNLRPRVETIVRPATLTAAFTLAVLGILSFLWLCPPKGFDPADPPLALLAILLGGPGGLAAYFAQAVPSRVTNAMLYGVRLLSLVPLGVSLLAAAAILGWGEDAGWPLVGVTSVGVVAFVALLFTYWFAEHPREQRPIASRQGPDFEQTHIEHFGPATPVPRTSVDRNLPAEEAIPLIRDRLLERSGGMSSATHTRLLWQRWFWFWETEVPPALYFDAAEAPAVFLGPASGVQREGLMSVLDELIGRSDIPGSSA